MEADILSWKALCQLDKTPQITIKSDKVATKIGIEPAVDSWQIYLYEQCNSGRRSCRNGLESYHFRMIGLRYEDQMSDPMEPGFEVEILDESYTTPYNCCVQEV